MATRSYGSGSGMYRFSVVIPAHNEEAYLGDCLASVKAQTFTDVQVLVVCDSCTDSTAEIARSFGLNPIEVMAGSLARARNAGMNECEGDYILLLHADDYYLTKDALLLLDLWLQRSPVDILAFGFMLGNRLARPIRGAGGSWWPNVWSKAWRSSRFGYERFGNVLTAEDVEWNERVLRESDTVGFLDIPLIQYRYPRDGSITARVMAGEWEWGAVDPRGAA